MESELLSLLWWANATLSVGVLIVLALRVPVRRLAGARVAYALWLVPLFAFLAWLVPARQVTAAIAPAATLEIFESATVAATTGLPEILAISCWLIGVGAMLGMFAWRQRGFMRSAGLLEPVAEFGRGVFRGAPSHGPAVVGALRPVIVLPRDFAARFSTEEQELVLAHERAHLDRLDPMINAAAMGLRAVNWFNPLVHLAARALRIDQELACDAAVLARHTGAQRVYAEAMLKSHAASFDIPVGCAWHTAAFHPLKERILMLKSSPSQLSRSLGFSLVAAAAVAVCGAVWLMRPAEVLAAPTQEEALSEVDDAAAAEAVIAQEATREAMRDAREAMQHAMREARAAIAMAHGEAAMQAKLAAQDAIAAARHAIEDVRPAIAAARREAEQSLRRAEADVRRAEAHALAAANAALARACRRAMARSPGLDQSAEAELRALEKLVCIPGKRLAPTPER